MGVIYLRTNTVNGMQYVGQTKDFNKRERAWNTVSYRYANQLLTSDRKTYGLDSFEVVILKECDNSELDKWEKHYIKEYNTIFPNGYNDNEGGTLGFHHSERTKKKISIANGGENHYLYGKHMSNKTREKIGDKLRGIPKSTEVKKKMSENNARYWAFHKQTQQHKDNVGKAMKGKFINREDTSKQVYQYTLDGKLVAIYPSRNEAARCTGYLATSIGNACTGGYYSKGKWVNFYTYKGYKWSYIPL